MSRIKESELYIYTEDNENFESYDNQMALFKTKIVSDMKHNGEIVEVIGLLKGKDIYNDRYIVRFNDGSIDNNIMSVELDFDYKKEIERKTNTEQERRNQNSAPDGDFRKHDNENQRPENCENTRQGQHDRREEAYRTTDNPAHCNP